eukprot:GHVN01054540.1.p1 GENE.GHVN01054540.1~~GHVN01054540.1.p1  ORF type:complete len:147 (-),score=5.44 GHVN01054540.1:170-568(-)
MTSEHVTREYRASAVAGVFALQGVGLVLSPIVALGLLQTKLSLEAVWRILLALGSVPALISIVVEAKVPHEKELIEIKALSSADISIKSHWKLLLGTSISWFLLDVSFYGTGSFKTLVGNTLLPADHTTDAI